MSDPTDTDPTTKMPADPSVDTSVNEATGRITSYLCIGCPLGCRLEVEENDEHDIVEVRGFSCKKGERFAKQEHFDPRRMVATTVGVLDGRFPRLPVRTVTPIPKALVAALCEELRDVSVDAPVSIGDVVLRDALGTGVDIVASRDMPVS